MTNHEEEYVHYVECINSLNRAWWILQKLRETPQRDAISAAAYRFALVEYAKSYTASDGVHRNRKKRNSYKLLPPPSLSEADLTLHQQILNLRDQVLAHSDMTWKEAAVYLNRYEGQLQATFVFNGELPFPEIDAVIGLTERTLGVMKIEEARRLEALEKAVLS